MASIWDRCELKCTLKCTLQGHAGEVNAVSISPDGTTIVSGSNDQTVR